MTWQEELTAEQKNTVEELKRRIINEATPKMLEDETLFYRFAKARNYDVDLAENMLRKHISTRKEYGIDTILTDFKPPEVAVKYISLNFVGYDKEGCVVRYLDIGTPDHKGILNSAKKLDLIKFNLQVIEQDVERMRQQSLKLGRCVSKVLYIYNFENFTFAKATHKKSLEMMLLGTKIYQDNYPERIKKIFIINASIYFTIMFSIVKSIVAQELLEKMRIFGTDGWKEPLLEEIDADVLPAFLGGARTDPDGNPMCNSFIIHGEPVPESYYLIKSVRQLSMVPGVKNLRLNPFSKSSVKFEVDEPGSFLEWEFETKSRDIGFGVYLQSKPWTESEPIELIPKQRIDTCFEPETGVYKCEKTGTYTLVFDNSYSWIYPKEIYYRAKIIPPIKVENDE